MEKKFSVFLSVTVLAFLISGCQSLLQNGCTDIGVPNSVPVYDVENLNNCILDGLCRQKVENLIVVVDDTSSMLQCFDGQSKRDRAVNILNRIVGTLPDVELNKGIRVYGPLVNEKENNVSLSHGMGLIPMNTLREKILTKTINDSMYNPLANALEGAYHEMKLLEGDSAIVLISDFQDPSGEIAESARLIRDYYDGRVCVSSIVIGNDGAGRNSTENIVEIVGCGISATEDSLYTGAALSDFVEKVLFERLLPLSETPVSKEEPRLSYEKMLTERQLTIELRAEFDFDKAEIRQEYLDDLQEISEFMIKYPDVVTTIEGHTDSIGTHDYNISLSTRRANSVKNSLVNLGIDSRRLGIASYGETKPIADNSTVDGRKKNRRAVAVITATIQEYQHQQK